MNPQLLNETQDLVAGLINANADSIADELKENPEGKLAVGVSVNYRLVGNRLYLTGKLSYARKFTDETESSCELSDPNQPELPVGDGATVEMVTGGKSTGPVSLAAFNKAAETITKKGKK